MICRSVSAEDLLSVSRREGTIWSKCEKMQAVFVPAPIFFPRAAPRARRIFPLTAPVESRDVQISLVEWAFVQVAPECRGGARAARRGRSAKRPRAIVKTAATR
jgi:hypothetical protein